MRLFRRSPVVAILLLLGILAPLVALGIWIWAAPVVRGHWEGWSQQLSLVSLALLELGGACTSTVIAYGARSLRSLRAPRLRPRDVVPWLDTWRGMPWLDTWRGQLMNVLLVGALPIASLVAALVIPPSSPLFAWAWVFGGLSVFVWLATAAWGVILHSHLAEETRA